MKKPQTSTEKDKFLLRIDKDLKSQTEKKAREANRSLNSQIITVLQNDLKDVNGKS